MAGRFIRSKYKANNGDVYRVVIQPETALLSFGSVQNAPTVNNVTEKVPLRIKKPLLEKGVKARKMGIKWSEDPPTGYSQDTILYIPILTPELFAAIQLDQLGTYLGKPFLVLSLIPER